MVSTCTSFCAFPPRLLYRQGKACIVYLFTQKSVRSPPYKYPEFTKKSPIYTPRPALGCTCHSKSVAALLLHPPLHPLLEDRPHPCTRIRVNPTRIPTSFQSRNYGAGSLRNKKIFSRSLYLASLCGTHVFIHSKSSELIVNIELLKIQNHGGQTIKTLTSFAIVRKDNDGQDWETCTRFASVSIEDILKSKPAANGTCCPPRDVHHDRPTLQSSNSWTRTEYFEPWQDVVDAYVPINDNHCPNDSYVV